MITGDSDDAAQGTRTAAVLRALFAFLLLPNLIFWIAGLFLNMNRGLVDIDYLLLGALWSWIPVWLRATLYAATLFLDAVTSTAAMYNVHAFTGALALTRAPTGLLIVVIIGVLIAASIAVLLALALARALALRKRALITVIMLLATLSVVAADAFAGNSRLKLPKRTTFNIATSSVVRFAADLRDRIKSASAATIPARGATADLMSDVATGDIGADNVVVIVVESMGELRDPELRALLWSPLDSARIGTRYDIERGTVTYSGGTTSGELRELCGIFADYITLPTAVLPKCLPAMLRHRGFTTFAVHGYKPSYYNRFRWYPLMFDSVFFDDDIAADNRCGTQFRGICDRDAFQKVASLVRGGRKRMVYWMTLDAHTPVDMERMREFAPEWRRLGLDEHQVCRTAPEVCLQMLFWRAMLQDIVGLAMEASLPPTRFVVAGDHAPAFVLKDRADAFISGRVPFMQLRPKPGAKTGVSEDI